MTRPNDPDRCCTATAKSTRARCGNPAIPGGTVCKVHGGAAPAVARAANVRLADLVNPAIATLARVLHDPDATPGDRLRAADSILDRTGHPRTRAGQPMPDVDPDDLAARIIDIRDRLAARAGPDGDG